MDVFDIILHEHIHQKQDVITLFPLKSHLIFGILRYKTCLFASQMLSLNQKNASKTLRTLVFSTPSIPVSGSDSYPSPNPTFKS